MLVVLVAAAFFLHLLPSLATLSHLTEKKAVATLIEPPGETLSQLSPVMNKPLIADFSSAPDEEYSPLTLRFLDMTRGTPEQWAWDFGDSTKSTLQHPVHAYNTAGMYNVTLTVTRSDGSTRTVTQTDVLGVTKPAGHKVLIDTLREGVLLRGSDATFVSTDANASVVIDGKTYPLPAGSVVKLRTGSPGAGSLNIRSGRLVSFAFPEVTLFVNGSQVAIGTSGDCLLPSYRYFQTNLTYAVLPTKGEMRQITIDGSVVRAGAENSRILVTHRSSDQNSDLTLVTFPAYFEGLASTIDLTTAVIADFDPAAGIDGPAPLNVTFRDTSAGSPAAWHWDFGDGAASDLQNPSHTYAIPGSYSVSLTVRSGDQSDTVTRKNAVVASPPRDIANFTAVPLKGPAPLTVRFTDTSLNAPTLWVWTFGPNATPLSSSVKDPVVIYTDPGTYTVSLTSGNIYGSSDLTRPQYITVVDPFRIPLETILVKTGKRGYVEKDSVIEFTIKEVPATININGISRDLKKGSVIRLVAVSDQQGEIYMDKGGILKFSFPDMELYADGNLVSRGAIDSIYIPYLTDFKTSLNYYLVPNSAYTLVTENGFNVLGDLDNAWIRIANLGMNSAGNLRLTSTDNNTYIDGAANQTVHDWVIK
jgi:PKD repeat protein